MKKIYLASPYSHRDESVRASRFNAVCKKAADLMKRGHIVFSPIAHSHPISEYIGNPNDADFYLKQDLELIPLFDEIWILALPGWTNSKGIEIERNHAQENGLRERVVLPN